MARFESPVRLHGGLTAPFDTTSFKIPLDVPTERDVNGAASTCTKVVKIDDFTVVGISLNFCMFLLLVRREENEDVGVVEEKA